MDYEKRSDIALHSAYASMSLEPPKGKQRTSNAAPNLEEIFLSVSAVVQASWGFRLIESIMSKMTAGTGR
jgi:hypothetical protein